MTTPNINMPDTGKIISGAYLLALLIILFVVYKILSGIGIIKSKKKTKAKEEKNEAIEDLRGVEYFNPLYLQGHLTGYTSLGYVGEDYNQILRRAIKGLGTDEEAIYSVFSRLKNKRNIAEISLYYRRDFKRDLLSDLLNDLTDNQKVKLMNIINELPN